MGNLSNRQRACFCYYGKQKAPMRSFSVLLCLLVSFFLSSARAQCQLAPQVGDLPQVACIRSCCNTPGRRIIEFTLSDEYSTFDCPAFYSSILIRLRTPSVCYYREGSSIVGMELDEDVATAVMGEPRDIGIPTLVLVTDPATGESKAVNRGLALGWIFFILFWMLLLVAVGLIVLFCFMKKKMTDGSRGRYEPVEEYDSSYGSQFENASLIEPEPEPLAFLAPTPATKSTPAVPAKPPKPAKPAVISCRIVHHYDASDESVLQANKGDTVRVLPKDFDADGDWVWALAGGREGYVPRGALQRIK